MWATLRRRVNQIDHVQTIAAVPISDDLVSAPLSDSAADFLLRLRGQRAQFLKVQITLQLLQHMFVNIAGPMEADEF